jgi:hypothetical protein
VLTRLFRQTWGFRRQVFVGGVEEKPLRSGLNGVYQGKSALNRPVVFAFRFHPLDWRISSRFATMMISNRHAGIW